jgi:L-threonylcarbamoyladenylate synthase
MISIADAAKVLCAGGIVAIPTETVYGLAANALDAKAVAQIFALKKRPSDNPLIVHVWSKSDISQYATIVSPLETLLIEKLIPGPLTILLHKKNIPDLVTAGSEWVAIRMPDHPIAQDLLSRLDFPLAAPSANISGRPSPTSPDMVVANFGPMVPVLDGGECLVGIESTVIQVVDGSICIHRPGFITLEDIQSLVWPDVRVEYTYGETNISPGVKYPHYAPRARVHRLDLDNLPQSGWAVLLVTDQWIDANPQASCPIYRRWNCDVLLACAQNLYRFYHQADLDGYTDIYVEKLPETGVWYALMNRVRKSIQ